MLEIEKSEKILKDIPYMSYHQALFIDKLIKKHNLRNLLELGWMYGTSSCYMASTLKDVGEGHLTTIDLKHAKKRSPNIEELLNKLDLNDYVTCYYEDTSYTWRLMKLIEENNEPIFDFCYIDGAHDWFTDGFAFLLVDKLLKPGGWIIFNDLFWTFESSTGLKNTPRVKKMPKEEKETPQVNKIFELLVKSNSQYCNFDVIDNRWGITQKKLYGDNTSDSSNENKSFNDYNFELLNEYKLYNDYNLRLLNENKLLREKIPDKDIFKKRLNRGTSAEKGKLIFVEWVLSNVKKHEKILDIGFGSGIYGKLLKAFNFEHIDGVDIWPKDIEEMGLNYIYDNIFINDVLEFDFDYYDLIIMGDVLEHMTLEDSQKLLNGFINEKKVSKMFIQVPFMYENHDAHYGNQNEIHIQDEINEEYMEKNFPFLKLIHIDKLSNTGLARKTGHDTICATYVWKG